MDFFLLESNQASSGAHPASYSMVTEGSFPRDNVISVYMNDHTLPSSARVKNEKRHNFTSQYGFNFSLSDFGPVSQN
jgi:hypothetical protein